jgi:hypothetical protein
MLKTKNNKIIVLSISAIVLIFALTAIIISNQADKENTLAQDVKTAETAEPVSEIPEAPELTLSDSTDKSPASTTPRTAPNSPKSEPEPVEAEVTLAPVDVPDESVMGILEEYNIEVVPDTKPQTTPAPEEQRPPDATTYIDGEKYVWDPVIGWIHSSGDGAVIIMDVEDDGRRYEGW